MTETMINSPPSSEEVGSLGVCHLKRFWWRMLAAREGRQATNDLEPHLDALLIDSLGLGLEQVVTYLLHTCPTFEEFEVWVVRTAGPPAPILIGRLNALVNGDRYPESVSRWLASIDSMADVFSPDDLDTWREQGFIVLRDAVTRENLDRTSKIIWRAVGGDPGDPTTWYDNASQRTMVQIFQHPALLSNRRSPRIHKGFAQLWGTSDLCVTTDRCGFSAPLRKHETSRSPPLHWDIDFKQPEQMGTQGVLYLTDTHESQGAFSVVPGFHRRLKDWLAGLPAGADPNIQDLEALGPFPIAGRAGDLIIWHPSLPHGSRPNHHQRPRLVHYINMYPARL